MPALSPLVRTLLAALAAGALLAGCQAGTAAHPVPSVAQIGGDLNCAGNDHGFEDALAGWGFCYPGTWKYNERAQGSQSPPGLDLTFDITNVPCTTPSPTTGGSDQPECSPGAGLFAFMIVSTYQRGDSGSLAAWISTNLAGQQGARAIAWGNAQEAVRLPDGRRLALTPHHVVIMDLHSGSGNLDLESQMSTRLDTWKFSY